VSCRSRMPLRFCRRSDVLIPLDLFNATPHAGTCGGLDVGTIPNLVTLYIVRYGKRTIGAFVTMNKDEIMTHRLWEVIVWLLRRAKDEKRAPEDCVNDIGEAVSLINAIASDPEASSEDRATAMALKEEASRLAWLYADGTKEAFEEMAVEEMAADKGTPEETREDFRVHLVQHGQPLKERAPDPSRWLQ
jgi:hypothetical protein